MTRAADERYMAAALRLARHHLGQTSTNPTVGCLIVKDDVILGAAVTAIGGRPHAETEALALAGPAARGAAAYVTLEPCSHHGQTAPCAQALMDAGIARVVIGVTDPDVRVSGRGIEMLRAAGIPVETGILEPEGRALLAGYLSRKVNNRPQVILKLAISADGAIGRKGEGNWPVTGPLARRQSHMLRAESDAILIGIGTALADDPELTCRLPGLEHRSPHAVVLDRRLVLPHSARLVMACRSALPRPLTVVCDPDVDMAAKVALEVAGAHVLPIGTDDLGAILEHLAGEGISDLIVEGGAGVAKSFLDADLVDRLVIVSSPVEIGEGAIAAPIDAKNVPAQFRLVRSEWFDPDRSDEYERWL